MTIQELLEKVIEKIWPQVYPCAGPRQLEEPLTPSPVLGMYVLVIISILGNVSRIQSWESNVSMWPSGLNRWLNPGKASIEMIKDLVGRCRDLLILWLSKTSNVYKFPWLLKLPPTNLEWSAFFFCLSLSSMYETEFWISPRELQMLEINLDLRSFHIELPPSSKASYFLWLIDRREKREWKKQMHFLKTVCQMQNTLTHIPLARTQSHTHVKAIWEM